MSNSSPSVPFTARKCGVVTLEGLRHVEGRLEARKYNSPSFASGLLRIITVMNVSTWCNRPIAATEIRVDKVSGALTNDVFFVSCPSTPGISTLLLRIYDPFSDDLLPRPRPQELKTLHVLSTKYKIGPLIYGTFDNGRLEQYFDSVPLSADDVRDPEISRWIATRMAELHQVDVDDIEDPSPLRRDESVEGDMRICLPYAREVLSLPEITSSLPRTFNIDSFVNQWEEYMRHISLVEAKEGASRRVLAHNDVRCGNLLRMNPNPRNPKDHRQIIIVDFEYAGLNPVAFDIANHFIEWSATYHGSIFQIDPTLYPTLDQRRNFYKAYITHGNPSISEAEREEMMDVLERQVKMWSPASHGIVGVWGVARARDTLEAGDDGEPEFDYLGYARCRLEEFQRGLEDLGLSV